MELTRLEDEQGRFIGSEWKCLSPNCRELVTAFAGSDTSCNGCGQEYNSFGQQLAPRSHWQEAEDY
jgi:uncharacterized protein (DUF983 family)